MIYEIGLKAFINELLITKPEYWQISYRRLHFIHGMIHNDRSLNSLHGVPGVCEVQLTNDLNSGEVSAVCR